MRLFDRIHSAFIPKSLTPRLAGIEISQSGIKAVELKEGPSGLVLSRYAHAVLPPGSFSEGEVLNSTPLAYALRTVLYDSGISESHVALSDIKVADMSSSRRAADVLLEAFDAAGIKMLSLEGEAYSLARALLTGNEPGAQLIVDIGKTTTKLSIVESRTPLRTETVPTGGHALTLVVQKHLGLLETEAWRKKAEQGIEGHDMPRAELLSAFLPIKEAIQGFLRRWHLPPSPERTPVSGVLLAGGNAALHGLPAWLETELGIPVREGDVFIHFASRDDWMPPFDKNESLMYGTVIGLALREYRPWTLL